MESDGLLTSRWEIGEVADTGREGGKPRRIFQITPEGKKVLSQWESALSDYEKYIHDLRDMICESI